MDRLTGFDATFLYAESTVAPFEIASCVVVDAAAGRERYSFDRVRDVIAGRLGRSARLRQRLQHVPFELDKPVWVDDPHFDLDRHVRRVELRSPGSGRELEAYVGAALAQPLDRTVPLWQLHIVEGLEGGRVAGFVKTHHAMVDGIAGFELLAAFLDDTPDPGPDVTPAWQPEVAPAAVELAIRAVPELLRQPWRTARTLLEVTNAQVRQRLGALPSPPPLAETTPAHPSREHVSFSDAPPTPFNAAIGAGRAAALVDMDFGAARRIASAADATINDVVITAVGGAARRYLLRHDALPDRPLVAFVPVSVRGDDGGDGRGGNRTSLMYASMATDVEDPRARLEAVVRTTRRGKANHRRAGAGLPTDLTAVAGAPGAAVVGRVLAESGLARRLRLGGNVVISNIPGPAQQLWFAGAPVERLYPFGPLVDGNALNVTVLSYRREALSFGLVGDSEAMDDLDEFADDVRVSIDELVRCEEKVFAAHSANVQR